MDFGRRKAFSAVLAVILVASIGGYLAFLAWNQHLADYSRTSNLIQPEDLTYMGAFRLPYGEGNASWAWGGSGATYYPGGDPSNLDAYPGSIYAIGHDQAMMVAEISIPEPVISRNLSDLNTATLLREFTNIRVGVGDLDELFSRADIHVGGLAYLPPQGMQTSGKLYACWGAHFQEEEQNLPSHMWCDLDFSNAAGAWRVGSTYLELYQSNDYMCEIPAEFADQYPALRGFYLATGRFREGGHGGQGPNLYAIAPWMDGNPPGDGTELSAVRLLGYSSTHPDGYDYGGGHTMNGYHDSDEWTGVAWLTAGSKSAVIFVGTKGQGECWYGYSDGTEYPTDGSEFTGTVPDYPHNDRGYWSTSFQAQIIFYNPEDLAAVASGTMEPYEPQPYAALSLDEYLYNIDKVNHPDFPVERNKNRVGGCAFDRASGYLYIFEYRGEPAGEGWNDDNAVVHVFHVGGQEEMRISAFPRGLGPSLLGEAGEADGFSLFRRVREIAFRSCVHFGFPVMLGQVMEDWLEVKDEGDGWG